MLVSLLDTNLCIRALRDRPPVIRDRLQREQDTLCISTVVLYELYVGAAQSVGARNFRPRAYLL